VRIFYVAKGRKSTRLSLFSIFVEEILTISSGKFRSAQGNLLVEFAALIFSKLALPQQRRLTNPLTKHRIASQIEFCADKFFVGLKVDDKPFQKNIARRLDDSLLLCDVNSPAETLDYRRCRDDQTRCDTH
jgi:hypothetical protein